MSTEARERWAQKKCPFGVGNEFGKCCTNECGAWREWDTRETVRRTEESWEDTKPGWFSDWSVSRTEGHDGHYVSEKDNGETVRYWVPGNKKYLWVRPYTEKIGSAGGTCGRLN